MKQSDSAGDVYRAPEADLTLPETESPEFYPVSRFKLMLLYFATLGLYALYWFYRHWRQVKAHSAASIWPVPRAIFSIFFAHSLFARFDAAARRRADDIAWRPRLLATLYVVFAIIGNLSDRLPRLGLDEIWVPIASVVSLLVIAYTLFHAQLIANIACGDPAGLSNAKITLPNLLWSLFGILFWLVAIAGFALELGWIDLPAD